MPTSGPGRRKPRRRPNSTGRHSTRPGPAADPSEKFLRTAQQAAESAQTHPYTPAIMADPARVLVVDDEQSITDFIAIGLRHEGFEVRTAPDGRAALRAVDDFKPHLVILDLMMPRMDGWELTRALAGDRRRGLLILSARDEVSDRVQGLELGADDYLVKPFEFTELLARVRAVLRRREPDLSRVVRAGALSIDTATREVTLQDRQIELSVREFDLLHFLAANADQVLPRQRILDEGWGYNFF